MSEKYVLQGWTPEAWQEQMYVEVKVAYRLSELGELLDADSMPYDADEIARIDAEYDAWLDAHDRKLKADARRGAFKDAQRIIAGDEMVHTRYRDADLISVGHAIRELDKEIRESAYRIEDES